MDTKQTSKSFEELWGLLRGELNIPDCNETIEAEKSSDDAGLPAIQEGHPAPQGEDVFDNDMLRTRNQKSAKDTAQELEIEINAKLREIRQYASWDGPDGERRVHALSELFRAQYPDHVTKLDDIIHEGRSQKTLFEEASKLGRSQKPKREFDQWLSFAAKQFQPGDKRFLTQKLMDIYERGLQMARRAQQDFERKKSGKPMSKVGIKTSQSPATKTLAAPLVRRHDFSKTTFSKLHPNNIRALAPQSEWSLLIDESGSYFEDNPEDVKRQKRGRFVGLLIPRQGKALPRLPSGWHAVDQDSSEAIDDALQSILDAEVGILGIELESLPKAAGERWMDGVGLLVDWVLRLLPVDGHTKLNVEIENRGIFKSDTNWDLVRRDCIRRLALAFETLAMKIDLDIRVINKFGHPCNGYVDAVAYTWARSNDCSKARLKQSGLLGTCLLDAAQGADARSMLHAWDAFSQGVNLPPEIWWNLLASPDATNPAALLSHLLTLIGNEAKTDAKVWLPYLQEVKSRMAYGPIELKIMAPAIDWLQQYCPPDAQILPAMRLVWLTVQLARANHQGEVENRWQQELQQLGDRLFEEAAPLVCHADLHLAVNYTNNFAFDDASKALARWQDVPPAVPGLQFWTHVQSSLGQHAAFTDDNAKAVMYFKTAMEAMQRLSDPQAKANALSQTGTYLAIAAMDDPSTTDAEVRQYIENITGALPEAAGRLAVSDDSSERYAHHLLLRWLTHRGDEPSKAAYLAKRADWQSGPDYPWPLIELYRGMLLRATEPETARELALKAADIAFSTRLGPTVHLIGACCRFIAQQWGADWPQGLNLLKTLKSEIPYAEKRIANLQCVLLSDPLRILKIALSFNFR